MTEHDDTDGLDSLLRSLDAGDRIGVRIIQNPESGAVALFPRTVPDDAEWERLSAKMHQRQAEDVANDPLFNPPDDDAEAEPAESFGRFTLSRM